MLFVTLDVTKAIMAEHPLTEYSKRSGKTATEIAKAAGVSRMTLYRLMKGEQNATISLLERVCAATDGEVTPDAFFPKPLPTEAVQQ